MTSSQTGKITVDINSIRSTISAMPLMVVAVDEDGIFVEWNKIAEEVTGWKASEIIGNPDPNSLLYPDQEYLNGLRQFWNEQGGEYKNRVWKVRCREGSSKWISWSNISGQYPVPGWTSWALGADVTSLIELNEKLQKKEHNLETIAHVSEVLLTEHNFDVAIMKALKALGESSNADRVYIFENDFDKISGKWYMNQTYEWVKGGIVSQIDNPSLQNLCYQDNYPRWQERMLERKSVSGRIADFPESEKQALLSQGILSILVVPVYLHDEWWGFIGFDNCTTDDIYSPAEEAMLRSAAVAIGGAIQRESINRQLREARLKAEEMNRLKSNFLANISHELRTPLIGILGYAEMLAEELPDPAHKKLAETIKLSGQRLSNSISLILDLSEIESDRISLNIEQVNITEVIRESVALQRRDAELKGLDIIFAFPENLPLIKSDRKMLQTILDNLLSNAIKFTDYGKIDFRVTVENGLMSRRINIIVSDTGIGISHELQQTIFDAFRQASEGLSRNFEGIGLGLTIIKKFTEKLGGTVEIQSKQDVGTTFTISFPTHPGSAQSDSASNYAVEFPVLSLAEKKKIVLAEADPASETMLKVFSRSIAEVFPTRNVEDIIQLASERRIDMIILDITPKNLFRMNDVMKLFRNNIVLGNTPVLAFSAYSTAIEKFYEAGFDGLIPKPITKGDYLKIIQNYLL